MPTKLQRNKLNNFIKYMKPYKVLTKCIVNISNGNFAMPKPLGIMAMTAPFGLLFVLFNIANINVANALSITVDGGTSTTKSFQLIPGSSNASDNVAISVASSDAAGGYTLSMTGPNAAKTLIGTTNSSNTLGPITSATWTSPSSFGDDTWGILPSKLCTGSTADTCSTNTAYKPAPGTGTQIIDVTTSANATATTYALAFGAKVSDTKTPDTYSGTITMTLTANATPYSIGFIDATTNMPDTIHGSTTDASVTLPTNIPTKDGYTFIGWCSVRTTDNTCSGTTYQPGGTYTLSNGAMTNLYAMWEIPEPIDAPHVTQLDHDTLSFSSVDGVAYYVSTSDAQPSASDSGWTADTTYDIPQPTDGADSYTYYVFAKGRNGVVSSASDPTTAYKVTVTSVYSNAASGTYVKVDNSDGATLANDFVANTPQVFYVFGNTNLYVSLHASSCDNKINWNSVQVAYGEVTGTISYTGLITGTTSIELRGYVSSAICF